MATDKPTMPSTPEVDAALSVDSAILDLENPFAAPSTLPYELPDFAAIREEHYLPAFRAGMAAEREEIERIVTDAAVPTVENTLDALERAGQLLHRVTLEFYNKLSADATDGLQDIEEAIAPELAAHHDAIYMDRRLHARLVALRESGPDMTAQAAYLLDELLKDFRRSGITLDDADQATLRDLNTQITAKEAAFGRALLAGANAGAVLITDERELDGLAPDAIAGAKAAAEARGHQDAWLLELQLPTQQNVIAALRDADVRERVQQASESRGLAGDHDTRRVICDIARLRAQRAQLLGYEHHAAYIAEDGTAKTTKAVNEMLGKLAPAAVANARRESTELAALASASVSGALMLTPAKPGGDDSEPADAAASGNSTGNHAVRASDWAFLAERVRKEKYDLDDALLRPYLELERVLHDGVFRAANLLYGISFAERADLMGYHPDVRVFEVFDGPVGEPNHGMALFLADFYTRESKQGGAWMNNLVDQSGLLGQRPVVVNNLNIVKPPTGEPTLLIWDEVITLFHEFGHALHGMFSDVHYPSQSGTDVPRDFVEFPSQVNEMWAWDPQILTSFAVHHETGEPMPSAWVDTMIESRLFNEGFATTEYLGAALLDQAWHQIGPDQVPTDPEDVVAFEKAALAAAGIDFPAVPPRYRTTYFNHTWSGGYSAGYYSYIWAEVLDAETVRWFTENGGLRRENGDRFRTVLLSQGGSADVMDMFRTLRGRDPRIEPLLERRGLAS